MYSTNLAAANRSPASSRERPYITRLNRVNSVGQSSCGSHSTRRQYHDTVGVRCRSYPRSDARRGCCKARGDRFRARGDCFTTRGDCFKARGDSFRAASGNGLTGSGDDVSEDLGPVLVPLDPDSEGGLGGTSDDVFGPLAALLIGFQHQEVDVFKAFMNDMEADMVKLIPCSKEMLEWPLSRALEAPTPLYDQPARDTPRVVILSGMYTAEVLEVISSYKDSGLPDTLWAGAVPGNWDRRIATLIADLRKDDELMSEARTETA